MRSLPTASTVTSSFSPVAASSQARLQARTGAARRLTLALALGAPLCAGALLAKPIQAAPTVESDENGPQVQIVQPGYNDVLKGTYRILIQVTARKYNPQSVEMFIDDQSATNGPMGISSFASSSYNFDTRNFKDGRHKLTVRVTDSQGFRGWSEVTIFVNNKGVIDTQAPDLKWVGIEPFQEFSGPMKIEVNAADNFGVKMIQISINPVDAPNKPAYSWMMNQPPYRVNLDTIGKNIPDGLYILKALAFDSLDQQGEAKPLTIGILNNAINATRVEDMLDGQKQMAQIIKGQAPAAPAKATTEKIANAEAPAKVTPVTPAKVTPAATPATNAATEGATARASVPSAQARPLPRLAPAQPSASTSAQSAPRLLPPTISDAQQMSNPGIQLPRIQTPVASTPQPSATQPNATQPNVTQEATPPLTQAPTDSETLDSETLDSETLDSETFIRQADSTEINPAQSAPQIEAPAETTLDKIETVETAPTETITTEVAPVTTMQVPAPTEKTLVAALPSPSRPVGQRNAGSANLSRAQAVDLALAPASRIEIARNGAPIAVTRFGQPSLSGRIISDVPVLSQPGASDESRLSNAELSRVRVSKTHVLNAAISNGAQNVSAAPPARALQVSAPASVERPLLGRAVTSDTMSAPASKLTRQAQAQSAPLAKAPGAATSTLSKAPGTAVSTLSKAVPVTARALPIAPQIAKATTAKARAAMSKAVDKSERAKPIELEIAPAFVAKNNVQSAPIAPQMSATAAPRMSESASGLGVPSKLSVAVERLTGKPQNQNGQKVESRNGERIAALPRPDAATRTRSGAAIVAIPLNEPLQIVNDTAVSVPKSYRVEQTMTLRAVAQKFGLPVEMVALSNNWTSDMKVLRGMEVKLPRPLEISYNGVPVKGDAPSMLMGDTAVTAFRFMFEKTGGKLEWDAANQRVIARKDGREIVLTIGSNVAKVGDREIAMELAAFLFQGRTMVPLRFFEEGMNAQVEWNPQTGRLVVAMAG